MTSIAGADATSNSRAVLDWDTLDFSYTGTLTLDWDLGSRESYSWGWAQDTGFVSNNELAPDWGDTSANAVVGNAWGEAWTTASEVGEEVYADTTGQGFFWAESWAYADRWGDFVAVGAGTLTVSIDYSLEQTLTTETMGDLADGWSETELGLENFDTGFTAEDFYDISGGPVVNGADFSDSSFGTLMVSLGFSDGDEGTLWMYVNNDAEVESVPAPGAILLCILGLGAAGLKLRKFS